MSCLLLAAITHIIGTFAILPGLSGTFLDASDQFVLFALNELQIVIGQLCKLLFDPAFDDIPLSFDF